MDIYSQHHLKRAATEPEHLIRKAEFDLAFESLGERIDTIEKTLDVRPGFSGGVMSSRSGLETMDLDDDFSIPSAISVLESSVLNDEVGQIRIMPLSANLPSEQIGMNDGVSAPSALPFHETSSLSDDIRHVKTAPVFGRANVETLGLNDTVLCPKPESLTESNSISESIHSIITDPKLGQTTGESLLIDDSTQIMNSKGTNMENLKMQGEIEVVLEDQDGNVKQREVVTNAITDAYQRYVFYDMLNAGTLSALLRSNTRTGFNFLSRTLPTVFGVYAMNHDINIQKDTFLPPYVDGDQVSLADGVSFYNVGGSMTESTMEMIPVDQRCYFDKAKKEFVFEYVKNTGVGTVKSVCVGRHHAQKMDKFSVVIAENAVPSTWATGSYFALEHTASGSFLWKTNASNASYRNNLSDRTAEYFSGSKVASALTQVMNGLVVGNVGFKAVKQSASAASYIVRLTYISDFRSGSTAATKDITFEPREGKSANSQFSPVMVMRPDRNELEIFVTLSVGDYDGTYGWNVQKAVVGNLDDPANLTVEIVDLGVLPYAVSNWDTTSEGHYLTGFYHDKKYYLPTYAALKGTSSVTTAVAAFQTGVVVPDDFSTIFNTVNFRTATASEINAFVLVDGAVVQCRANLNTIPYVHLSQIVSGSNLPQAVTKNADDVLRIIYRYKIA